MPTGRPTRLTPAIERAICKALARGNYLTVAAELAGVGRATVYRWLALADGGDARYGAFRDALKKARAKAESDALAVVMKAGKRSWVACAWYLERAHPERWRRREHSDDPLDAIAEVHEEKEPDALDNLKDALHRNPNEIGRAVEALRVLDEIVRMNRP